MSPSAPDPALAAAVRRLRDRRGLTQEDLAHAAGLTTAALARVERGQSNPRWTTVRQIATALRVSMSDLAVEVDAGARDAVR